MKYIRQYLKIREDSWISFKFLQMVSIDHRCPLDLLSPVVLCFTAQLQFNTSVFNKQNNMECSITAVFTTTGTIIVDCINGHKTLV